jgi:hypothetical protein
MSARSALMLASPPRLSWQHDSLTEEIAAQEVSFDSPIMTVTIIEYVVAAHGREQLPVLIAAMGQHTHTGSLIPATFGVSVAEFEAGWQSYLAEQYGVK